MTLEAELVLPSDVELVQVRDLTANVRAGIDAPADDYTVTRVRSRAPSRVIDKDSAELLRMFRSPTRIVDAVLSFADRRNLDPERTLEQAYPLLCRLFDTEMLVPASAESDAIDSASRVGSVVEGFRLLRCVQALEDTEVFLARDAAGAFAAVKFCPERHGEAMRALEHEAKMMYRAEERAPAVYALTRVEDGISLITAWVFGLDAANRAAGLRGRREPRNETQLLALCLEIVEAFADVHASGVLHGDVHPRNVLVEPGGSVRLIDFGLARDLDEVDRRVPRGGVAFYFDPQFAQAQLSRTDVPLLPAGEQYSVAALLYLIWTGVPYLDWRLERTEMLRQIVEEQPAPFASRSIPPWPELEHVLCRALDKRPERRFESMAAFAGALRNLVPRSDPNTRRSQRRSEEELLRRTLARYDVDGPALLEGPADAPFASINHGAGGIAYAIYRIAQRRGSPRLIALADLWVQKAYALSAHERAFYEPEMTIEPATVGEISLFHSVSGLHCVRGLVSIALGDVDTADRAIDAFVLHSRLPCDFPDLTVGTASILLGCAEMVEALPAPCLIDLEPVCRRGEEIAADLAELLQSASIATATSIPSLGVAHGWGGFLFALLRWAKATGAAPAGIVADKLGELASLAEPHGGGLRWPVYNATRPPTFMDSWCNGTAGHALLYALARDVLGEDGFAELAESAAESAWASESQLGTLCCGLAGVGYAFLAVHRVTGAQRWVERARVAARRAACDTSEYFFLDALYKGAVGVAVLSQDLEDPDTAAMPLFEPTLSRHGVALPSGARKGQRRAAD